MYRLLCAASAALIGGLCVATACGPGDDCGITLTCDTGGGEGTGGATGGSGGTGGSAPKDDGESCADGGECKSGFCADGVCCATACDATCEACAEAGSPGLCVPVAPATDPDDECAGDGVCDGSRACATGAHLFSTRWGDVDVGVWAHDVAVDGDGNVFIGGLYSDDFVVGGTTTLVAEGFDNAWLAKFDATGAYQWANAYSVSGTTHNISRVAADEAGNVAVVGFFGSPPDPFLAACGAGGRFFVAKLDGDGIRQWCEELPTQAAIAMAPDGDLIVAAAFLGTVDFGPPTSPQTAVNNGLYVARFGPLGNPEWVVSYDNINDVGVDDVAIGDDGRVTVIGRFDISATFGGAPLTAVQAGLFVLRLQGTGEPIWSRGFGDDVFRARGTADGAGRVLVSGRFSGSIDFGAGPIVSNGADGFVAALDPNGDLAWQLHADGDYFEPDDTHWDAAGNAIIAATIDGTLELGGMSHQVTAPAGMLIAKIATDGTPLWSRSFGCEEHNRAGLGSDPEGNVWWGGDYFGTIDFGGGPLVSSSEDAFLVKLSP